MGAIAGRREHRERPYTPVSQYDAAKEREADFAAARNAGGNDE